ncbi:hypothetical protein [Streptomyces sp. NBC_01363]|uniref:hypothetical protein n=1 Tax=Streptomyces sp. NBC_01363 TaxID=2903840 RepID=UPI00225A6FA9|nr:hypothetical protein [Streptomyces sp. NBC_01363]MCX4734213.1 hypothetical protein [Streptomyces sp. NBC_01363]
MKATVPRDREGAFEPKTVRRRQKPLPARGRFPNEGRAEARTERLRHHPRRQALSQQPARNLNNVSYTVRLAAPHESLLQVEISQSTPNQKALTRTHATSLINPRKQNT